MNGEWTLRCEELSKRLGYAKAYVPVLLKRLGLTVFSDDEVIIEAVSKHVEKREASHGVSDRLITIDGESRSRASWSRKLGLHHSTLRWRAVYALRRNPSIGADGAWEQAIRDSLRGDGIRYKQSPGRMPGVRQMSHCNNPVTVEGETRPVKEWAKILDMPSNALAAQIANGELDGKTPAEVVRHKLLTRASATEAAE